MAIRLFSSAPSTCIPSYFHHAGGGESGQKTTLIPTLQEPDGTARSAEQCAVTACHTPVVPMSSERAGAYPVHPG
jgi:hypothetical protein